MDAASAPDRVLALDVQIHVEADASITVTESFRVPADAELARGFVREVPARGGWGAGLEVLAAARDGYPVPWRLERDGDAHRIRLAGAADPTAGTASGATAAVPVREYSLTYRAERRIDYFDGHDELYWKVTGDGWPAVIDSVQVTVALPVAVPRSELMLEAFASPADAAPDVATERAAGLAQFRTGEPLPAGAGLTVVVGWPKGIVAAPAVWRRTADLLLANLALVVAGVLLAGVSCYVLRSWYRYGRASTRGAEVAHYLPPDGHSADALGYLALGGYGDRTLAAGLVGLAVKGYLKVAFDRGTYQLFRGGSRRPLGTTEAVLQRALFETSPVVELTERDRPTLESARQVHSSALRREYLREQLRRRAVWLLVPLAATLIAGVGVALLDELTPYVLSAFGACLVVVLAGAALLRTPTQRERMRLEQLRGFQRYLSLPDSADPNRRLAPQLDGELFERYLPFAVALGVEADWAAKFADVLVELGLATRTAYQPGWFLGDFYPHQLDRFVAEVGADLADTLAELPADRAVVSGSG